MSTAATSNLSYTEKKRIRMDFGKLPLTMSAPYLLGIQLDSYAKFLKQPGENQKEPLIEGGLDATFRSVFPIKSFSEHAALDYVNFQLGYPAFSVAECRKRGLTYGAPLRVRFRLTIFDKDAPGEEKPYS